MCHGKYGKMHKGHKHGKIGKNNPMSLGENLGWKDAEPEGNPEIKFKVKLMSKNMFKAKVK